MSNNIEVIKSRRAIKREKQKRDSSKHKSKERRNANRSHLVGFSNHRNKGIGNYIKLASQMGFV